MRLRREPVLVDQPAEQVAAPDVVEVDHLADRVLAWRRQGMERWPLAECAVRPVLVVMRDVRREGALEVAPAKDQQSIETLAADGPDPAFGVRPCLWCPYRRLDHTDAFGAEDLVELAGELAVAVADEEQRPGILVVEFHEQVARLLGHRPSGLVVIPARRTRRVASSMKNNT